MLIFNKINKFMFLDSPELLESNIQNIFEDQPCSSGISTKNQQNKQNTISYIDENNPTVRYTNFVIHCNFRPDLNNFF
jgi:hypothetical protein